MCNPIVRFSSISKLREMGQAKTKILISVVLKAFFAIIEHVYKIKAVLRK